MVLYGKLLFLSKFLTVLILTICLFFVSGCSNNTISKPNYQKALLVVDVQEDCTGKILKPPFLYQKDSETFISKLNKIIDAANKDGVLVIYMTMNSKMEDTPGAKLDARLKVINNNVFLKDNLDAFLSSDHKFEKFLTGKKEIKELYLIGLDATLCINETAKDAVKRGYKTTILTDAIATISDKKINEIIDDYKMNGILVTTSDQIWKL
ncbi:MAG: cysteine hydrolase [Desulfosporosinus sp.]|nr:cysteine hydrolase [Desulfosporosinus sp.]